MPDCLTIRHFFWGSDIALPRLWPFHDLMAARTDIDYRLHLVGRYPAAASDISGTVIRYERLATSAQAARRGVDHSRLEPAAAAVALGYGECLPRTCRHVGGVAGTNI